MGRGGRIILDRTHHDLDDFWRTVDFTIYEPSRTMITTTKSEYETNNISDTKLTTSCYLNSDFGQCYDRLRTSNSGAVLLETLGVATTVKSEPIDANDVEEQKMVGEMFKEEGDDVVEFLRRVRKEW